jgi:hypothetical protein
MCSALGRLVATTDPRTSREYVIEALEMSADVELPLVTQTDLVTYVLLLDLDGGRESIDHRVLEVVGREIARSRQGYRLRSQHYLVLGALLTVSGELELAARALAAHDQLGGATSPRTRALIEVARSSLDARLADAAVAPAPPPDPADLPMLASDIHRALVGDGTATDTSG